MSGVRTLKSIDTPRAGRCSSRRELERHELLFPFDLLRHRVTYSNAAYQDFHRESFSSQKDAVEFAERIQKSYRYIWISELGKYREAADKWVMAWIYYWWSPAATETDWGECPDQWWGYPEGRKYLSEYRPLVYRGKQFAHLNVRASSRADTVKELRS